MLRCVYWSVYSYMTVFESNNDKALVPHNPYSDLSGPRASDCTHHPLPRPSCHRQDCFVVEVLVHMQFECDNERLRKLRLRMRPMRWGCQLPNMWRRNVSNLGMTLKLNARQVRTRGRRVSNPYLLHDLQERLHSTANRPSTWRDL